MLQIISLCQQFLTFEKNIPISDPPFPFQYIHHKVLGKGYAVPQEG